MPWLFAIGLVALEIMYRGGDEVARFFARANDVHVVAKREQAAANVKLAQANLEQAQAELHEAERAFRRSRDLLERKFVSQAAHDTAVARLEKAKAAISGQRAAVVVAQANLRAAEVEVEHTLIRAPFDGVVLTKNANVGDVITPFSSASASGRCFQRTRSRLTAWPQLMCPHVLPCGLY